MAAKRGRRRAARRIADAGRAAEGESNKFVYEGDVGTHMWYDGTQHPVGVQARLASRAVADDPDMFTPAWRTRRSSERPTAAKTWQELPGLRTAKGHSGSPAPAGCACTRSCSIRRIRSAFTSRSRPRAPSARDDGGQDLEADQSRAASRSINCPIRMRRSAIACIASRCIRRARTCCSCRSTGT